MNAQTSLLHRTNLLTYPDSSVLSVISQLGLPLQSAHSKGLNRIGFAVKNPYFIQNIYSAHLALACTLNDKQQLSFHYIFGLYILRKEHQLGLVLQQKLSSTCSIGCQFGMIFTHFNPNFKPNLLPFIGMGFHQQLNAKWRYTCSIQPFYREFHPSPYPSLFFLSTRLKIQYNFLKNTALSLFLQLDNLHKNPNYAIQFSHFFSPKSQFLFSIQPHPLKSLCLLNLPFKSIQFSLGLNYQPSFSFDHEISIETSL